MQKKNIIDTLHFVLNEKPADGIAYTYREIMTQIQDQFDGFHYKTGYWPDYINMESNLYLYLQKLVNETCDISTDVKRLFGATITTRKNKIVEALSDREIICLKEDGE